MSKLKIILEALNLNTLKFNFKYLPFKTALKLPILVSRHTRVRSLNGTIEIQNNIKTGMILIGFDGVGIFDNKRCRSIWSSDGSVIAACSVVTKNIDTNNCISAGTPNRIVKSDIKWKH